jgi:hypothetical protein
LIWAAPDDTCSKSKRTLGPYYITVDIFEGREDYMEHDKSEDKVKLWEDLMNIAKTTISSKLLTQK